MRSRRKLRGPRRHRGLHNLSPEHSLQGTLQSYTSERDPIRHARPGRGPKACRRPPCSTPHLHGSTSPAAPGGGVITYGIDGTPGKCRGTVVAADATGSRLRVEAQARRCNSCSTGRSLQVQTRSPRWRRPRRRCAPREGARGASARQAGARSDGAGRPRPAVQRDRRLRAHPRVARQGARAPAPAHEGQADRGVRQRR